jgi:leucyl aminopeptidase (aminopeptidase T)
MDRLKENARITARVSCGVKAGDEVLIIIEKNTKPPYHDELLPVARAMAAACMELGATPVIADIHEWMNGPAFASGGTPAPLAGAIRSADVVINAADRASFRRLSGRADIPIGKCASGEQRWFVLQSHKMAEWQITAEQVGMIHIRSTWLADLVRRAPSIEVRSPAGTQIVFDLADGVNAFPYLWLVPLFGEVPVVPSSPCGEGVMIVDGPTQRGVRPRDELDRPPLRIEFENGRVRDFQGDPEQVERLRAFITGGQPRADAVDEIGIPTTDIEENSLYWWEDGTHGVGRIHIAIGNNTDRRQSVHGPSHMDCEICDATVTVGGLLVVRDGVFVDENIGETP